MKLFESNEQKNMKSFLSAGPGGRMRVRGSINSALLLLIAVTILTVPVSLIGATMNRIVILIIINIIAVIGISIFSGNSGILTIGHVAFYGIGAYVSGLLTTSPEIKMQFLPNLPDFLMNAHMGLFTAILIVGAVSALLGLITGLPISRLRDTSAIIATFALLVISHFGLIGAKDFTNGNKSFYGVDQVVDIWTALAFLALSLGIAFFFKQSTAGLQLRSFREDETAAKSMGVHVNRRLLESWIISACIMGVAGALFAHTVGAFAPRAFYFFKTFELIAMLIVGGLQSVSGAVVGTIIISVLVEVVRNVENGFVVLGFEVPPLWGLTQFCLSGIILLVLYLRPAGLLGSMEAILPFFNRLWPPSRRKKTSAAFTASVFTKGENGPGSGDRCLRADSITKNFFGLQALHDVSIQVKPGQVIGLVGPNGAGKTTLINSFTGSLELTSGRIFIDDAEITGWSMHHIALNGLGRTFQNIRLFKGLTVRENVMVSVSANRKRFEPSLEATAESWLEEFGLLEYADRMAGTLPYGHQRELEIARALALRPRYLLLDEPGAGMNRAESEELLKLLQEIRLQYGVGILIVDHDLHLIMKLCDRVVVINKGEVIASGKPGEIQKSPEVIEAYLGTKKTGDK